MRDAHTRSALDARRMPRSDAYVAWRAVVLAGAALVHVLSRHADCVAGSTCIGRAAATTAHIASGGLDVALDADTGAYTVSIDGQVWLSGGLAAIPYHAAPDAVLTQVAKPSGVQPGTDMWGSFQRVSLFWGWTPNQPVLVTSIRAYNKSSATGHVGVGATAEFVVMSQSWPQGGSGPPNASSDSVVAPFPTFWSTDTSAPPSPTATLNLLQFGGCQLANTFVRRWNNDSAPPGGVKFSMPAVLYNASGRAIAVSPGGNHHVAVYEVGNYSLSAGIKATVSTLPAGVVHETLLVGGASINASMVALGDALLARSRKQRVDPISDPQGSGSVLTTLGYWTDNGAFYNNLTLPAPYGQDHEAALKDAQRSWQAVGVPFRYVQWDDWWSVQDGLNPGVLWWWPRRESVPDGLSNWLGMPTALYQPMYAAANVYRANASYPYKWVTDAPNNVTVPIDVRYFRDAFANASRARMVMYEQDFLCTVNEATHLTDLDVDTGNLWLGAMNEAAMEAGVTLQLCMANGAHVLAGTQLAAVTNVRATSDNTHNNAADLLPLGLSSMFVWAMGMWPSRDNVLSSPVEPGCSQGGTVCSSLDYELQNAAAVLSGGPYGPGDGAGFFNRDVIMRSCRDDGVLLRVDKSIAMLDAALLAGFDDGVRRDVWAAHSQIGPLRWSYVLAIGDRAANTSWALEDLGATPGLAYVVTTGMVGAGAGLDVGVDVPPAPWAYVPAGGLFTTPASLPPAPGPRTDSGSLQVLSPVLPNGWCLLGEVNKTVAASRRRFRDVRETADGMSARVLAASGEAPWLWLLPSAAAVRHGPEHGIRASALEVVCAAGRCRGDDCDVETTLTCHSGGGVAAAVCTCE